MKKRNVALCVIFSLLTCGIYGIYWIVKLNNDTLEISGEEGIGGGLVVLLTLVTCGLYGIYWNYKQGERLSDTFGDGKNRAVVYLILCCIGLGIVSYILQQSELNKLIDEAENSQPSMGFHYE